MTHCEHPLELLYDARQEMHTAATNVATQSYRPDDVAAYEVATVTVLDGLYLLIDTLVEQCVSRHWPVFAVWPPPGYDRLLRLHATLRTVLMHLHRYDDER